MGIIKYARPTSAQSSPSGPHYVVLGYKTFCQKLFWLSLKSRIVFLPPRDNTLTYTIFSSHSWSFNHPETLYPDAHVAILKTFTVPAKPRRRRRRLYYTSCSVVVSCVFAEPLLQSIATQLEIR